MQQAASMRQACGRRAALCGRRHLARAPLVCRAATQQEASANYKKAAAKQFVDKYVNEGTVLGLGSGELVNLVIEDVSNRMTSGKLHGVVGVPACDAAAHEAAFQGLPLATLASRPKVDVFVEEVDALDAERRAAVKGLHSAPQQPQLPAMRAMAAKADKTVFLVDANRVVPRLVGSLPVVIDAGNWEEPAEALDDVFLGDAEIWRRPSVGTSNPRGGDNPYVSPEGHNIVDIRFYEGFKLFGEDVEDYGAIAAEVEQIGGVVAHGLLLGVADAAVVAREKQPEVLEFK